ncbi:MAG: hypothetical protein HOC63_04270 [Rhodospirillales bacterium]|jgi:hypothetical protein|nr:hypothetical protein [Rhodospirillales bacterium]MBT4625885.1 hypothetical protein [Rhodospirillales bacterium]MBT5350553.1 hypothetical protein [Rhodospirillales bacterium]MBT5522180.1 hypothetical protein [Rhodospirillales bacterium]MBT6109047.1 hypothetical protein [Rhodospirillales bacterium]
MNTKNIDYYSGAHWQPAGAAGRFEEIKIGLEAVPVVPYLEFTEKPRFFS